MPANSGAVTSDWKSWFYTEIARLRALHMHILLTLLVAAAASLASQEPAPEPTAKLILEVTQSKDGSVLAGAKVAAHWNLYSIYDSEGFGRRPGESARGQTDAAGRCELEVAALKRMVLYVQNTEHTRLHRVPISDDLDSGETRVVKISAHPPTITVRGSVVDWNGNKVPGAKVQATWGSWTYRHRLKVGREELMQRPEAPPVQECFADGEGFFELVIPDHPRFIDPFQTDWAISASASGLVPLHRVRIRPFHVGAEVGPLTLDVTQARTLTGTLLGENGQPAVHAKLSVREFHSTDEHDLLPGVTLINRAPFPGSPFLTDEDGKFQIPNMPVGRFHLNLDIPRSRRIDDFVVNPDDTDVTYSVERKGEDQLVDIVGRVVDPQGNGIADVQIQYRKWGSMPQTSDAEGNFLIPAFRPEQLGADLKFYAKGYSINGVILPKKRSELQPLEITLQPELTIQGRVIGPDGQPRGGMEVQLSPIQPDGAKWPYWKSGYPHWSFDLAKAVSDQHGTFTFRGLWPGQNRIEVRRQSITRGKMLAFEIAEAGATDLTIQIGGKTVRDGVEVVVLGTNMGGVSGQLIDAETGDPIREYSVFPVEFRKNGRSYRHSDFALQVVDEEGRFHFSTLGKGKWAFVFEAEGYRKEETLPAEVPSEKPLVFQLGIPTTIQVQVVDNLGKPVQWAVLDAAGLNGDSLAVQSIEPLGMTDESGKSVLERLPKGKITLLVWPICSGYCFRFPVDLQTLPDGPVKLTLDGDFSSPRQKLDLTLRTSSGKPVKDSVSILAYDTNDVVIAAWGMFFYNEEFSVNPGHDLASFLLQIPPSGDSVLPFELPPGRHRIKIMGDGWQHNGPEVEIVPGETPAAVTIVIDDLP